MSGNNLLTQGLQKGFANSTDKEEITRGGFQLTSSHYEDNNGIYHDEWVTGGGQELLRDSDGQSMTRTYVGNVVSSEKLNSLGITETDVMILLKKVITDHGDKIRFNEDFKLTSDDWQYSYRVTYKREDPFIINGIEEIFYKDESVFVHTFGISKVVEA